MMRWISRACVAGAALSALAITPGADAADGLSIDHVEASGGTVSIVVGVDGLPAGTEVDTDAWEVTVNGETLTPEAQTIDSGQIQRTTILALDASQSMKGDPFEAAKAAAGAFLEAAPPDVQIGLVTFAGEVTTVAEPTTDRDTVTLALDNIELSLDTHLYDGIVDAVALAGDDGSRSVLVLSDGKDRGSAATLEEVSAAATDGGVVVDVVALDQAIEQRGVLDEIAAASGGQVIDASSPAELQQVFEAQADALRDQVLLQFEQPEGAAADTTIEVSLATDEATFTDSALVSLAPISGSAPEPVDVSGAGLGDAALLAGVLALGVGLAMVLAVLLLGERGQSRAERQIASYFGSSTSKDGAVPGSAAPAQSTLRESAIALSEMVVKSRDLESRLNARLVGGGLSLTAAEWLLIHAGITLVAALVGLILGGGAFLVVGFMAGAVLPWLYLRRKHSKRLSAFNAQLAETLDLIAGGLAAGLSMPQAVDTVVREGTEPMAGELRRALIEQRLGVDIEDGLDAVATRMSSDDFGWVVMAIRIQREVGGNLAELLRTVSGTLREREYLRRQVQVLSAEGRFSAWVLGALPIAMFLYMLAFRKEFVDVLYTTGSGLVLLSIAIVMMLAGFWVMSRLVKIEV